LTEEPEMFSHNVSTTGSLVLESQGGAVADRLTPRGRVHAVALNLFVSQARSAISRNGIDLFLFC
jgi:hypothetical protein